MHQCPEHILLPPRETPAGTPKELKTSDLKPGPICSGQTVRPAISLPVPCLCAVESYTRLVAFKMPQEDIGNALRRVRQMKANSSNTVWSSSFLSWNSICIWWMKITTRWVLTLLGWIPRSDTAGSYVRSALLSLRNVCSDCHRNWTA